MIWYDDMWYDTIIFKVTEMFYIIGFEKFSHLIFKWWYLVIQSD